MILNVTASERHIQATAAALLREQQQPRATAWLRSTHLGFLKVSGIAVMPPGSGCLLPSFRLLPCTCRDASDSTHPGTLLDTTWKPSVAWWRPSACKQRCETLSYVSVCH